YWAAIVIGAISGHVDRATLAVDAADRKRAGGVIQRARDGGAALAADRGALEVVGKRQRILLVANHTPRQDDQLIEGARPLDVGDCNLAVWPGCDRLQHVRVAERLDVAIAL